MGLATGVTALTRRPLQDGGPADVLLLVTGSMVLLLGARFLREMPTAPGAALTALALAACCLWAGLRRTGWSLRPLLTRLARI